MKNPINEAISKAGSQTKLAGLLKIHKSNISHWVKSNHVPYKHRLLIEKKLGVNANKFESLEL